MEYSKPKKKESLSVLNDNQKNLKIKSVGEILVGEFI
jgi:hypothetical protein